MAYVEIEIDLYLFGQIQTSQTGGQVYRETSPNKVWECSLVGCIQNCTYVCRALLQVRWNIGENFQWNRF